MNNEKVIQTIKKVLELSKNNPSEGEARAAALKAQELLAKYHIDMKEVEDIDLDKVEEISEINVRVPAKKWKYKLAKIVANNFRCKHFYYGKSVVVFYGHQTDANIAAETFQYLFKTGDALANRYVRKIKRHADSVDGVYNSFVVGYCQGVEEALSKQCRALMLVVPQDVEDGYNEMSSDFRQMRTSGPRTRYNSTCLSARERGVSAGRDVAGTKMIS